MLCVFFCFTFRSDCSRMSSSGCEYPFTHTEAHKFKQPFYIFMSPQQYREWLYTDYVRHMYTQCACIKRNCTYSIIHRQYTVQRVSCTDRELKYYIQKTQQENIHIIQMFIYSKHSKKTSITQSIRWHLHSTYCSRLVTYGTVLRRAIHKMSQASKSPNSTLPIEPFVGI